MTRGSRVTLVAALLLVATACGSESPATTVAGPDEPASTTAAQPSAEFAVLRILAGTVEVDPGDGVFASGLEGQTLKAGYTVRTGPEGRAAIEYFEGSITRLDYDTTFTLVALESLGAATVVEGGQTTGNTYQRVAGLTDAESRFDVETPTATASVQGTVYAILLGSDGSATVAVFEGSVLVAGADEEVLVTAGFMVTVNAEGNVGDPVPISEAVSQGQWIVFNRCEVDAEEPCETPTGGGNDVVYVCHVAGSERSLLTFSNANDPALLGHANHPNDVIEGYQPPGASEGQVLAACAEGPGGGGGGQGGNPNP